MSLWRRYAVYYQFKENMFEKSNGTKKGIQVTQKDKKIYAIFASVISSEIDDNTFLGEASCLYLSNFKFIIPIISF